VVPRYGNADTASDPRIGVTYGSGKGRKVALRNAESALFIGALCLSVTVSAILRWCQNTHLYPCRRCCRRGIPRDLIRESSERSVDPAAANLQGTTTDMQTTMSIPRSSALVFRHRLVGSRRHRPAKLPRQPSLASNIRDLHPMACVR
jgi:hypothetical protein